MNPSHAFQSLAGIIPGLTTIDEVAARFGPAHRGTGSDGKIVDDFEALGVSVRYEAIPGSETQVVEEVSLCSPNRDTIPCGVHVGMPEAEAVMCLRGSHEIDNVYDDAVYFRPSSRDDLLASVEFFDASMVVSIELMYWPGYEW